MAQWSGWQPRQVACAILLPSRWPQRLIRRGNEHKLQQKFTTERRPDAYPERDSDSLLLPLAMPESAPGDPNEATRRKLRDSQVSSPEHLLLWHALRPPRCSVHQTRLDRAMLFGSNLLHAIVATTACLPHGGARTCMATNIGPHQHATVGD